MRYLFVTVALVCSISVFAQNREVMQSIKSPGGTVCYMGTANAGTVIPPPKNFMEMKKSGAKTQAANIQVTYNGFSIEARDAFDAAVDIWESQITSSVTIRIEANWAPLGATILGGASPGGYYTNFDGAPRRGVWYPVALAEKIAGKELNDTDDPDIVATFNSNNNNWHFGLTGEDPPAGKYDLMTVVLHEIGHGLGITHSYDAEGTTGIIASYFSNQPVVYETNIENQQGENIVTGFDQGTVALKTQLTSDALFYDAPLVLAANAGNRAKIFAPNVYSGGSSIAHLNETTFPAGTINSLMTPQFQMQERVLDPGPITMAILKEMGWIRTRIDHEKLVNSENPTGPFVAMAKIVSDDGYDQNSVRLHYTPANGTLTEVTMTPTAVANEFSGAIPGGINTYEYYISVKDINNREFTTPGVFYQQGEAPEQFTFPFAAGPDNKSPFISHRPVLFLTSDEPLSIDAVVSDNFGVDEVMMDWKVNDVDQPSAALTKVAGTDSTYAVTKNLSAFSLGVGDVIKYRLRAKDIAIAGNVTAIPSASEFFSVNIAGLEEPREFYTNDFNSANAINDFFGNGFDISTPSGFANGAINTVHPYPEGFDAPNEQRNLIFNLKFPIIVKAISSTIRFDEIVLVEPGEPGTVFGQTDFYDYVVVEGSKDGGTTWSAIGNGYDSRDYDVWLSAYNANLVDNISATEGTPTMYRAREISLLSKYQVGDEVAIRFRLFSDPHAAGWGWAIDNLRIQVDETPPLILHQHVDHVMTGTAQLDLDADITDAAGLQSVVIEYQKTGQSTIVAPLIVTPTSDSYSFEIPLGTLSLTAGSELQYRIRATDKNGNVRLWPTTGFFNVAVLAMTPVSNSFTHDFNSATNDVSGNFFDIQQPSGFNNGAMHTIHPYTAISSMNTEFTFVVEKPIRIAAANALISFDEIVLAEYSFTTVKDYVIVEGSLDGKTWEKISDPYSSNFFGTWRGLYDTNTIPAASAYSNHLINLTASGKFKTGDVILIRFRLFSDLVTTGWGWAIDNLSIQGPATGVESDFEATVFPNPARDKVQLGIYLTTATDVSVSFISLQGQVFRTESFQANAGKVEREFSIDDLPSGLLLMKVDAGESSFVKKLIRE